METTTHDLTPLIEWNAQARSGGLILIPVSEGANSLRAATSLAGALQKQGFDVCQKAQSWEQRELFLSEADKKEGIRNAIGDILTAACYADRPRNVGKPLVHIVALEHECTSQSLMGALRNLDVEDSKRLEHTAFIAPLGPAALAEFVSTLPESVPLIVLDQETGTSWARPTMQMDAVIEAARQAHQQITSAIDRLTEMRGPARFGGSTEPSSGDPTLWRVSTHCIRGSDAAYATTGEIAEAWLEARKGQGDAPSLPSAKQMAQRQLKSWAADGWLDADLQTGPPKTTRWSLPKGDASGEIEDLIVQLDPDDREGLIDRLSWLIPRGGGR